MKAAPFVFDHRDRQMEYCSRRYSLAKKQNALLSDRNLADPHSFVFGLKATDDLKIFHRD